MEPGSIFKANLFAKQLPQQLLPGGPGQVETSTLQIAEIVKNP